MLYKLAPFLAGLGYGGWAAFSNWSFGSQAALLAFLIQGGFAFSSTWALGRLLAWCQHYYSSHAFLSAHVWSATFVSCSAFLIGIPGILHLLAGTPNILMAMLPGMVIGHGYVWLLMGRSSAAS